MLQACTSTKIKVDKKNFCLWIQLRRVIKSKIEKKIKKCFDPISILRFFFVTELGWLHGQWLAGQFIRGSSSERQNDNGCCTTSADPLRTQLLH